MPGTDVPLRAPADLVARFHHRLATEPDWAVENQFLPVWLHREPVAVQRARAALLDRARYLARCENDATEYHTWCIAPHALRVAAYATWLETISPWSDADRQQLGRDLVQFCRQHVVAVLSGRAPSADNQFLSMSLTCGIVGEGLRRLGVERDSAAWLAQLGLDRARQWIGLMPPDGYSGEGSTYQMEVVSPLAMWLAMLLIEQEGRAVFEKKFGPNSTSLRAILELHRDLASPAGCAPGWDNHGWTTYYTLSPLVYLCRLTGEPVPVDLIRQNWDEYDTICWRADDRVWALLCWPQTPHPAPLPASGERGNHARSLLPRRAGEGQDEGAASPLTGWTRRHCAAVIDHRPTRSRLMLCADRTSDTVQAVGRYQCNPNHVLWEVNGTAIFGDGGRDPDARLASDVTGLRARLEPERLEMILQQYGSLENLLAAVDTGLIGQANTVVVAGQREWFPFDAVAGQRVFEQRAAERHMVGFDSRAIYDPALPLRVARRFIAMDAAGIGWIVDDYRATESLTWDWQVYLPPVEVPVTLGWPVRETHRYEPQPHYPKPLSHGVWTWSGSRRLMRSFTGKELRTATVLLPFVAKHLRVQATGTWSWEATWDGGGASVSVPDLGAEPVAFAACPATMSGSEPPWPADPACAKITDAELLACLEQPAPAAWRETVRALRELMARGNRAVAPAAVRLLQDDRQRYHVHSVACAALTQVPDPSAAAVLRRWTWTPEPNIAARARAAEEKLRCG